MKLYEINEELRSLMEMVSVDEETGEVLGDIDFDRINDLVLERDEKIENIALFIKELRAEIEAMKTEVKKFNERIGVKTNKIKSLSNYLDFILTGMHSTRFETSRVVVSYRKSEAVEVEENRLPKKYMKVELSPDKTMIKNLIKSGQTVRGAHLIERRNIQIK